MDVIRPDPDIRYRLCRPIIGFRQIWKRSEFKYGWIDTIAISCATAEIHIIEGRGSESETHFAYSETLEKKKEDYMVNFTSRIVS